MAIEKLPCGCLTGVYRDAGGREHGLKCKRHAKTPKTRVFTEVKNQFWRESEQEWVNHVNIVTWGSSKDTPTRWRHQTITTTVTYGEWEEGKG